LEQLEIMSKIKKVFCTFDRYWFTQPLNNLPISCCHFDILTSPQCPQSVDKENYFIDVFPPESHIQLKVSLTFHYVPLRQCKHIHNKTNISLLILAAWQETNLNQQCRISQTSRAMQISGKVRLVPQHKSWCPAT